MSKLQRDVAKRALRRTCLLASGGQKMKILNTLWSLTIGIDLGALMVVLTNQYAATLSTFIIWAVMVILTASLTFYTVRVRQPRKKRLPVRRASRVSNPRMKVIRR